MLELVVVYNWKVGNGRKKTLKVRKTDGKRKTEKQKGTIILISLFVGHKEM
jgi:hypothetical protein